MYMFELPFPPVLVNLVYERPLYDGTTTTPWIFFFCQSEYILEHDNSSAVRKIKVMYPKYYKYWKWTAP